MPTPFVVTTLFVLTTLNNAGQLVAVDKSEWPTLGGGPIFLSESGCMVGRGKMVNPERYVCQGFRSAPTAQWVPSNSNAVEPPPADADHASLVPPVASPKAIPRAPGSPKSSQLSPPRLRAKASPRSRGKSHSSRATSGRRCSRATRLAGCSIGEAGSLLRPGSPQKNVASLPPAPFRIP